MLTRFLKDPLLHFLVAGLVVFIGYGALNGYQGSRDDSIIIVDDERLAVWLQFRNKAFNPGAAMKYLGQIDPAEKQMLIDDYVREEAMYRHGLRLGLDGNDAIIRQRLVQKMDYIALGLAEGPNIVAEEELIAHYQANQAQYRIPASVSFKHIFFEGFDGEARARAAYAAIQQGKAPPQGDRFLYRSQYAEAGYDLLKDELGMKIAETVLGEITPKKTWLRPLFSNYGWHLIWIADQQPSRMPPFEEVVGTVLQDVQRARTEAARTKATDAILEQYEVKIIE